MKKNSLSKCFEIIDQLELDLLDIVHREKPSSFNDKKKIVDLRTKSKSLVNDENLIRNRTTMKTRREKKWSTTMKT